MEENSLLASFSGKTFEEVKQLKVEALGAVKLDSFEEGKYSIIVDEIGYEGDLFKVVVRAYVDGKKIFVDNPYYFRNPPISVEDGTFQTATNEKDEEIQVPNTKVDLVGAVKKMIIDTLEVAK